MVLADVWSRRGSATGSAAHAGSSGKSKKGDGKSSSSDDETSTVSTSNQASPEADSAVASAPVPAGVCISEDAPKRVSECPKSSPKNAKSKGDAPSSKLHESKRKVEQPKGVQAKGPSIELDVATLRNKEKGEKNAKDLPVQQYAAH